MPATPDASGSSRSCSSNRASGSKAASGSVCRAQSVVLMLNHRPQCSPECPEALCFARPRGSMLQQRLLAGATIAHRAPGLPKACWQQSLIPKHLTSGCWALHAMTPRPLQQRLPVRGAWDGRCDACCPQPGCRRGNVAAQLAKAVDRQGLWRSIVPACTCPAHMPAAAGHKKREQTTSGRK